MEMNKAHLAGLSVILFDNLKDDFGFVIGRANKRYTLWKYIKEDRNGVPFMVIKYIQVLSDKRFRVEQRFPDIFICEELRGEKRMELQGFTRSKSGKWKPASAPKTLSDFMSLPFGQFSGISFREVSDWYWCNLLNKGYDLRWTDAWDEEFDFTELIETQAIEAGCKKFGKIWLTPEQMTDQKRVVNAINWADAQETKDALEPLAKELGCIKLMNRWYTGFEMEGEKPWMTTARQILPFISAGQSFSFTAHYNGNGFWFGLPIEFLPEDKEDVYTYYGSSHFLKVTNKKGVKVNKRVKGKTIEVSEYDILEGEDQKPYVLVKKFNII